MKNKMNAFQKEAREENGHFETSMNMGRSAKPPIWEAKAGKGFPIHATLSRPNDSPSDNPVSAKQNTFSNPKKG